MSGFRPVRVREQAVVLLMVAHVLLSCVSIWSAGMQVELVERMHVGDYELGEPEANDERQTNLAIGGVVLHLITAVAFLFWFRRVYDNLTALDRPVSKTLGGPIVAWFIPFVNFVRPFQITKQIWLLSDPKVAATEAEDGIASAGQDLGKATVSLTQGAPPWMAMWWGSWIASGIVTNIASRSEDPLTGAYGQIAADLLTAASGVLAIYVVRQISERQRALGSGGDEPAVF